MADKENTPPDTESEHASSGGEIQHTIVLVTGMSGAGKSVALKTLEDIGFEAMDNIPLSILSLIVKLDKDKNHYLAIGIDIRSRDFSLDSFKRRVKKLRSTPGITLRLIFLDSDDDVLQRRFTETRRKHPISTDRLITDGIRHERELIGNLRDYADWVIDTSEFKVNDLKQWIKGNFLTDKSSVLSVVVTSFSFRRGIPREADFVIDVRFLQNPHYVEELRDYTGITKPVQDYVTADPNFPSFFNNLSNMILPLLPLYDYEGKHYFTIAIGCTGGKHRSVTVAEKLAALLKEQHFKVDVRHRDMPV